MSDADDLLLVLDPDDAAFAFEDEAGTPSTPSLLGNYSMHILFIDEDAGDLELVTARFNKNPVFKQKGSVFGHEYGMKRLVFYSKADLDLLPHAIIMEAKFSDGSALDLIRFIKSTKKLKDIPVVIYTGTDDEENKRAVLVAGAMRVIHKVSGGPEELAVFVATLGP